MQIFWSLECYKSRHLLHFSKSKIKKARNYLNKNCYCYLHLSTLPSVLDKKDKKKNNIDVTFS